MKRVSLLCLLLILCYNTKAQVDAFSEIDVYKNISNTDKWKFDAQGVWKITYSKDAWTRLGVNGFVTRKLGIWSIEGGLINNFTYSENITNFWEFRQSAGLILTLPVFSKLTFSQRGRMELRNIIYTSNISSENKVRTRYRVSLAHPLKFVRNNGQKPWDIRGALEWYFVKNPVSDERFPSSREFSIRAKKMFKKNWGMSFGYQYEKFSNTLSDKKNDGHTALLSFYF